MEGLGTVDGGVILTVIFTGIGCSAIAFSLSAWAQRTIDASRASILNLLEPVVAGVVGYAVGERLGAVGYAGAALILAGIFVAERGTHDGFGGRAEARYLTARSREAKNAPMPEVTRW